MNPNTEYERFTLEVLNNFHAIIIIIGNYIQLVPNI